jgi:hypothetical protein
MWRDSQWRAFGVALRQCEANGISLPFVVSGGRCYASEPEEIETRTETTAPSSYVQLQCRAKSPGAAGCAAAANQVLRRGS